MHCDTDIGSLTAKYQTQNAQLTLVTHHVGTVVDG